MPRCSSAQRSVASAWREKRKQVVSRVRGVCDDVTCPFLHSGVVQILKAGQVHTNDPFCCPNSPLQSSYIWFAGWPKPYSYRRAQNRLNNSRVKLCHVRLWQVEQHPNWTGTHIWLIWNRIHKQKLHTKQCYSHKTYQTRISQLILIQFDVRVLLSM